MKLPTPISVLLASAVVTSADTEFAPEQILFLNNVPVAASSADLDGDGDTDLMIGGSRGLQLIENADGQGTLLAPRLIGEVNTRNFAADIDGDTDLDIVAFSGGASGPIFWHRNDGGVGQFSDPITISASEGLGDEFAPVDLDGDDDLDLAWYDIGRRRLLGKLNDGSGNFAPTQILLSTAPDRYFKTFLADINGDEIPDLVVLDPNGNFEADDDFVAMRPGLDTSPITFGAKQTLVPNAPGLFGIGKIDADGDPDLLVADSNYDVVWRSNDGMGNFSGGGPVWSGAGIITGAVSGDMDDDGDRDVLIHEQDGDAYLFRNDGTQSFAAPVPVAGPSALLSGVDAADLDGDGRSEVVSISGTAATVHFQSMAGSFDDEQILVEAVSEVAAVFAGDLTGDHHAEILFGSGGGIIGIASLGRGDFALPRTLLSGLTGVSDIRSANIDGQDGIDLFTLREEEDSVGWHAGQSSGSGEFGAEQIVDDFELKPNAMTIADFDGNGTLDLAVAYNSDGICAWYDNAPTTHNFGYNLLSDSITAATAIASGDFDKDNDVDIVAGGFTDGKIYLFTNGGTGNFSAPGLIGTAPVGTNQIEVADVNGDGELDVLVLESAGVSSEITAFFGAGDGSFPSMDTIYSGPAGVREFAIADLDADDDPDLVSGNFNTKAFLWHQNDGSGGFSEEALMRDARADRPLEVAIADLDGDGDPDIAAASSEGIVGWFRNDFVPQPPDDDPVTLWAWDLGLREPEVLDLTSDGDRDGATLLEEFAFNLDPRVANSRPLTAGGSSGMPALAPDGPNAAGRFVRRRDAATLGLSYAAQISTDLETWTSVSATSAANIDADYEIVTFHQPVDAEAGRMYLRLRLDYAPPGE